MTSDSQASRRRFVSMAGSVRLIDVHHHFEPNGRNAGNRAWSSAESIAEMDENGVSVAIGYAGPVFGNDENDAATEARRVNEWSAEVCRDHRGRFGLFASLPMTQPDEALDEIAFAFEELGADGVGLAPRYGTAWLGAARFRPIFAELDRRAAVVYVHPARASSCASLADLGTDGVIRAAWIEYPTDTARTVLSMWEAGIMRDFPNIRFLFCHGGGVLPILLGRFAGFSSWHECGPELQHRIFPEGVYAAFARLHVELAQAYAPETIQMLQRLLPETNLLFGTDFSYFPIRHAASQFNDLDVSAGLRRSIASENAERLFPRWSST